MSEKVFQMFLNNLKVSNRDDISTTYRRITTRLNADFHHIDSDVVHSLQVGSFGRRTAIDGISDLDMVFELSKADYDRIDARAGNGQSALLQEVKASLLATFPKTDVVGDGPVVVVPLKHHHFEVLPAFLQDDGSYVYGDTKNGGSWKSTNPRAEKVAFDKLDIDSNGNARSIAKMLRAWKNQHGVPMSGWLIDSLVADFFSSNNEWAGATLDDYPSLLIELFDYLAEFDGDSPVFAPGSGAVVPVDGNFSAKASKALKKCREALDSDELIEKCKKWKSVFGVDFQMLDEKHAGVVTKVEQRRAPEEQFIEEIVPVDIQYSVKVDYEVSEDRRILFEYARIPRWKRRLPIGNGLRFYIASCNVPEPFQIRWKVKNRGARSKGKERGSILLDEGKHQKIERTNFSGDHYVEAYIIKDGVCVARDRAMVPIVD